jgi:hypothetical protein
MRALKTRQQRDQFRSAHLTTMPERAKARGTAWPDAPPAQGEGH